MLHASKERLTAAEAELIRIQRDYFVKRIVVGKPDGGWAVGEAILNQDIPPGYRLNWKAANAEIQELNPERTKVRINVGTLRAGTTRVTATIENIPQYGVANDGESADPQE